MSGAAPLSPNEALEVLRRSLVPAIAAPISPAIVILAVSGGPDSLALLAFAGENRGRLAAEGVSFRVATVDHGLRPEAAREAGEVATIAARFGLPHETLRWHGWNGRGNLSAAARDARYALLEAAARRAGARAILVAHHEDDQIETHLLALARGGGLAGMRSCRDLAPGLQLLRPFLSLPKARLFASLARRDIPWADDPTNRDGRFRRVQVRQALGTGGIDRAAVLEALARARAGREDAERALGAAIRPMLADLDLSGDEQGRLRLTRDALRALPEALACDLLSRALTAAGGGATPPPRAAVARLEAAMRREPGDFAATLNGCQVRIVAGACVFEREYGRAGPAPACIDPGSPAVLFDRRFDVPCLPGTCVVTGARVLPFGRLGRGTSVEVTLPVIVDGDNRPLAAHEGVAAKLGIVAPFRDGCRVGWRLLADLRDGAGRALKLPVAMPAIPAKGVPPFSINRGGR